MILLLILLTIVQQLISQQLLLPTYGGGCGLIEDKLYYLGGSRKYPDTIFNRVVYSLDLKQSFNIDNIPWELKNIDQLAPSVIYPNLFIKGDKFYVRGGLYTPYLESVKQFDVKQNEWLLNNDNKNDIIANYYNGNDTKQELKFTEYLSNLIKINDIEAILLGGYIDSPTRNNSANQLITKWDTNSNEWSIDSNIRFPGIYDFASFFLNDNIYSIGGQFYPNNSMVDMSYCYIYNINNKQLDQITLNGDIPKARSGHLLEPLNDTHVIMLGGAYATGRYNFTQVEDSYLLDIINLNWIKIDIQGFLPTYRACLVKYKNNLIYSLGYSNDFNNLTQLIDLNSLKLNQKYEVNSTANSLPLILGLSLGFAILLIVVIIGYCLYRRKRKKMLLKSEIPLNNVQPIIEPFFVNHYPPSSNGLKRNISINQHHLFTFNELENEHSQTFDDGGMLKE